MTESELYKSLGELTRNKGQWHEDVPYVASILQSGTVKIQAKAPWLLGEMVLAPPFAIEEYVPAIASFLDSNKPLLRERSVIALGRIGRGRFQSTEPYWEGLFRFSHDVIPSVRLAFIWASENIATHTPDIYGGYMPVFAHLLTDANDRVRMEALYILCVLGKRRPAFVQPYINPLRSIAKADTNRVVRIHYQGAINAVGNSL